MSDTRNHTTRDQLAEAIRVECFYGGLDEDRAEYARMADALLASDAIAAVRAAAVAETTAAIEALLDTLPRCDRPIVGLYGAETRCVRRAGHIGGHNGIGTHGRADDVRAALSGGRTAHDTTLAQAWDDGANAAVEPHNAGTHMTLKAVIPFPDNPYRADTGADQ